MVCYQVDELFTKALFVYEFIHGMGPKEIMAEYLGSLTGKPLFTWYHLPANNVCVQDILYRLRSNESETS